MKDNTDCLANLPNCKASCCRCIAVFIKSYPGDHTEDYYVKHGITVKRINREMIQLIVPNICKQLDETTNLCKLHDSGNKPIACKNLGYSTTSKYYITEGCIYK